MWNRASARFFAPRCSAQNDKSAVIPRCTLSFVILRHPLPPVILRSAATKDLALARSPDGANTKGWRAEVVAQASFSWPFGPIHLLAPYGAVSHA